MNKNNFFSKLMIYVPVKLIPALLGIFFIFYLYKFFPKGQYVSYSIGLTCALIAAQLFAGWVGNSFIYYFPGNKNSKAFFSNCLCAILLIAPVASVLAASVSLSFVPGSYVFICICLLCFSQILFFFLSSVCQAGFLVKEQLLAVIFQALGQVLVLFSLFSKYGVDFRYALLALSAGYLLAAIFLLVFVIRKHGFENPFLRLDRLKEDLNAIYKYGAALSPWMLGMLVMAGSDRFVIGQYSIEHGDSYLSLKDLFVGGSGLLSMPLLMMVHPLVIRKFREGRFAASVIESSVSFLIIAFSLLWGALYFVGFDFFENITGKMIGVSKVVIFISFVSVFLNCTSVYIQKRLEVHRRLKLLAYLSLLSAVTSLVFAYIGGYFWGIYGVSIGVLSAQCLYFYLVAVSMYKRLNLYQAVAKPTAVSVLALVAGFAYYHMLQSGLSYLAWWMKPAIWLVGFTGVSIVALWKGVGWNEFIKNNL